MDLSQRTEERSFASNYFIFLKILFQFKNLLTSLVLAMVYNLTNLLTTYHGLLYYILVSIVSHGLGIKL